VWEVFISLSTAHTIACPGMPCATLSHQAFVFGTVASARQDDSKAGDRFAAKQSEQLTCYSTHAGAVLWHRAAC
jgi:hypothetical protein